MRKQTLLKSWLLLFAIIAGVGNVWGGTAYVDITPTQALNDGGVDPITIVCAKGDGTSNPAISSGQLRLYQASSGKTTGNTITFSSERTITKIEFTFANNMTADNGVFSEGDYDSESYTWTGSTNSVTLTVTGTKSGERIYITAMKVYYENDGATGPTLSITSSTIAVGGTATISAPEELAVSYESSNESVAAVSTAGVVTGVAAGEATITASWAATDTYNAGSKEFTVTVVEATTYEKVTSTDQLVAGNEYIIVATESSVAMGAQNDKLRKNVAVSIANDKVSITNEAVAVLTLGGNAGAWTFLASDNNQYLALTANSNEIHASNDATLATSQWTITDDFQVESKAQGDTRYIRYNSGSPRFACYKSGQVEAYLFVKSGSSVDTKQEPGFTFSAETAEATLGEAFSAPTFSNPNNVEVTFASSDKDVATINEQGEVTIVAAGTTTISATSEETDTYRAGTASYTLTVVDPNAPGTKDNPYTVEQARAAIDAGTGTQGVYAKGFVSEIVEAYNSQYENITFTISADGTTTADQLEAYRCKGSTNYPADNVHVGDEVVIYGNLTKYGSTYEFAQNCQIVALTSYTGTPIITAPSEITLEAEATSGEFAYSITNPIAGETLTAEVSTDVDWISNIQVTADKVTFTVSPNQIADKRMTVMYLNYESADSKNVTIHQKAYIQPGLDYATLPFEFDGGKNDVDPCDGLSQDGLGTDYSSSPKLKFDNTGDWLLLHFNERPGTLTFDIKGNTFSGGTFKLQTSADGTTFTDLKAYTELGAVQNESFDNLAEDVRYIKWIYTSKSSGNVALGNIKLYQYDGTPSITVTPSVVNVTATETDGTLTVTYNFVDPDLAEVKFCNANGGDATYDWIDAEIDDDNNVYYEIGANEGEARTAYLMVYGLNAESNDVYSNIVTITQAAYVALGDWVETTLAELTEDDVFVIVGDNGDTYAMSNDNGTGDAPDAVAVTVVENTLSGEVPDNIQWNVSITDDGYIFYPNGDSENWLYCTNTNNGVRVGTGDAKHFTLSSGGYLTTTETSEQRYLGIYNSTDWRCYKKETEANIRDQVFKFYKKASSTNTVSATVSQYKWATFSSDKALDFSTLTDVEAHIVTGANGSTIVTEKVEGTVAANTGLLLYSETAGDYEIPVAEEGEDYSNSNKLIAVTEDNTVIEKANDGTTNYVLAVQNEKAVFAYIDGVSATLGKGKAYLKLEGDAPAPFLGFDGEGTTGINSVERGALSVEGCYTLDGRRVAQPTKGLYIVNGKKVMVK